MLLLFFQGVLGLLAIFGGLMGVFLVKKLVFDRKLAMTKFKLKPEKLAVDYKIFVVSVSLMAAGFGLYIGGVLTKITILKDLMRLFAVFHASGMNLIFLRWCIRLW